MDVLLRNLDLLRQRVPRLGEARGRRAHELLGRRRTCREADRLVAVEERGIEHALAVDERRLRTGGLRDLDKPLRNHTLMQTITRANRVFPEKNSGLIVAYVDVFKNLQKALAIYAIGGKPGGVPIEEKGALVDELQRAIDDLRAFCERRDVDLDDLGRLRGFELVRAGRETVEMLMVDDEEKVALVQKLCAALH